MTTKQLFDYHAKGGQWTLAPSTTTGPGSPPTTDVLFGDSVQSGATNLAGVQAIATKYGVAPPVVRLFWETSPGAIPAISPQQIVGSHKVQPSDAAYTAWASQCLRHTYWHEIDHHSTNGDVSLTAWQSVMNHYVTLGMPGLSVILTANSFQPGIYNVSRFPASYMISGVTHLGVDLDGASFTDHYHDYDATVENVATFVEAHGLDWFVGELGANRATSTDPTGSARAAWLTHTAENAAGNGANPVCLWEATSQTGSTFDLAPEKAAVATLFGSTS